MTESIYRNSILLTLVAALVSCSAAPEKPPVETIRHSELNIDGHARLGGQVIPTAYELDLTIDPAQPRFSGDVRIDVSIDEPLRVIQMHAKDLDFESSTLTTSSGEVLEVDVVAGENGGIAVITPKKVSGEATLSFTYTGPLDEVTDGLYRVEADGEWYAFTQFEPLEARQAFPSFDEPVFKTPYKTTMRVPTGLVAATNGPTANKESAGELDVYTFETTMPLPTYLVAFAVGAFDIVEAPADAIPNVPFRVLATKGNGHLAAFMLEQTPPILKNLTDYFEQAYPYQKLDVVAVPNFSAGAMENVGLVTFRESLLLLDPATASVRDKRSALSVMAHELAHMWFGNYVTLAWWDDLWLNESFATWMAAKVLDQMKPELESDIDRVRWTSYLVGSDSLVQSRSIRQPIEHGGDVYNAFDGITYGKGARVLGMFESWTGAESFRQGVKAYIAKSPHGTGTTEELLAALDEATGKPVGEKMRLFLDQPGAPLLSMTKSCDGGKTVVAVEQTRYLPAGSEAPVGEPWSVPVCVRYGSGEEAVHCGMVEGESSTLELPTKSCAPFIYPNANEAGYFRWTMPEKDLVKLVKDHRGRLTTTEKVGLLANASNLLKAEKLSVATHISLLEAMSRERHRTIVTLVIDALYGYDEVVSEEKKPAFQKWVRKLLSRHADRVGYEPKPDESVEVALLRPRIVAAMVRLGGSDELTAKAKATTTAFLKKMNSVPADMADLALPLAARDGDASLWLSYKMAIEQAPTPAARGAVLAGLGSFQDPQLVSKSLGLILDGSVRSQDFWSIVGRTMSEPETQEVMWNWMTENFDKLVEIRGVNSVRSLPSVGRGFCSEEGAKKVETFFAVDAHRTSGTERTLSKALESIRRCVQFKAYASEGLAERL